MRIARIFSHFKRVDVFIRIFNSFSQKISINVYKEDPPHTKVGLSRCCTGKIEVMFDYCGH